MPFQLLRDDSDTSEFAAFLPDNFEQIDRPPLIIFLHGSGERGNDPGLPLKGNAHVFENLQLPAAIIFPQCNWEHRAFYGAMEERVFRAISIASNLLGTDSTRAFLSGYSMGGSSSLWLAAKHKDKFPAVICIAPGITWMGEEHPPHLPAHDKDLFVEMFVAENRTELIAAQVHSIPFWFLQGTEDEPCPIEETRQLVSEMRKLDGRTRLTEFEGLDHESLTLALEEEGLFDWLLSHRST